jgi:hypothetical protein
MKAGFRVGDTPEGHTTLMTGLHPGGVKEGHGASRTPPLLGAIHRPETLTLGDRLSHLAAACGHTVIELAVGTVLATPGSPPPPLVYSIPRSSTP